MNTVITIGRKHGSGGREIGKALAGELGVPFYDKRRLKEFAVENGLAKTLMESYGERHASSVLYALATGAFSFGYHDPAQDSTIAQKVCQMAFESIKAAARKGPCVIVGRCADYVLRDTQSCFNIFIHAPEAWRAGETAKRRGMHPDEALREIRDVDRMRSGFYNYHTAKNWGEPESYHLCLDSSWLGRDGAVQLLRQVVCEEVPMYR